MTGVSSAGFTACGELDGAADAGAGTARHYRRGKSLGERTEAGGPAGARITHEPKCAHIRAPLQRGFREWLTITAVAVGQRSVSGAGRKAVGHPPAMEGEDQDENEEEKEDGNDKKEQGGKTEVCGSHRRRMADGVHAWVVGVAGYAKSES